MITLERLMGAGSAHEDPYQSKPVPLSARHGFRGPALVWSGFGVAFISAVIGGLIQRGLGTVEAILAILLGNWILFVYSAAIAFASGKWGMNFSLTAKAVFGERGALAPIVSLALLCTGWFAFQGALAAQILCSVFGIEDLRLVTLIAICVSAVFALPVIWDPKHLATVMKVALPTMILFAGYLIAKVAPQSWQLLERTGTGSMTFSTGVAMAWGTFVVGGTMTGDIVRFTKTGNQAVAVTAVAFLFANAPFMLLGALMHAASGAPGIEYLFDRSSSLLLPFTAIAILSNWASCAACLSIATLGFTNALRTLPWRMAGVASLIIAVLAIASQVTNALEAWLIWLGVVVPPIGAVITTDYFVVRRAEGFGAQRASSVNWAALIALLAGLTAAYCVKEADPALLFPAFGWFCAALCYIALSRLKPKALGAGLTDRASGAEAADLS
jgi:cytosine permease